MEVYVEKPIDYKLTMMALVAKDTHFTSALTLPDLPPNTDNNPSKKVSTQLHPATSFCNTCSGTFCSIPNCIDLPTDDDDNHHHDCRQSVNLTSLWHDIWQTSALFSAFLATLHPVQPVQLTTMPTTDSTDDKNGDNDTSQQENHHRDFGAIQCAIAHDSASFKELLNNLAQPPTQTISPKITTWIPMTMMTMTSTSMDDGIDEPCNDNQQPMDHLPSNERFATWWPAWHLSLSHCSQETIQFPMMIVPMTNWSQ